MTAPVQISVAEANARYDLARWLDAWDADQAVTVHAAGAALPALDLQPGPCLAIGDLEVGGDIVEMDDGDGFLVVLGRCKARNLRIGGPEREGSAFTGSTARSRAPRCTRRSRAASPP